MKKNQEPDFMLGMMAYTFNPGTWEADFHQFQPGWGNIVKLCLTKTKKLKHPLFIYNISALSKKKTLSAWQHKLTETLKETHCQENTWRFPLLKPSCFFRSSKNVWLDR